MIQPRTARALLTLALFAPLGAAAQDKPADKQDAPAPERRSAAAFDPHITDCRRQINRTQATDCNTAFSRNYTVYLQNTSSQNEANEILVAVRNVFDPSLKVFLDSSQNALAIVTYPEEFARIDAFVKTLDRPHKSFRVTYTLTEFDGDRRVGTQHFTLIAVDGQRTTLKQGSKIPVATGSYGAGDKSGAAGVQTQFTYLDVGVNIDNTLTLSASGLAHLRVKVEQSSVAPDPNIIAGVAEPVIRQSVLDGSVDITPGKPVIIGSVDLSGTTHRLDVAAAIDPIS